jgi:hypothetical protein
VDELVFLVAWQGHIFTEGISQAISEESETRRDWIGGDGRIGSCLPGRNLNANEHVTKGGINRSINENRAYRSYSSSLG